MLGLATIALVVAQPACSAPLQTDDPVAAEQVARARLKALAGGVEADRVSLMIDLGRALHLQERFAEAEAVQRDALNAVTGGVVIADALRARLLYNQAETMRRQGRFAEAEPLSREALRLGESADMAELPRADFEKQLAGLLLEQQQYGEAEGLARRSLERRARLLGPDDPRTLNALTNVAEALEGQNRHADAEPLYRRAYAGRRAVGDRQEIGDAALNLGWNLDKLKKHAEAEPLWRESLAIAEAVQPQTDDTASYRLAQLGGNLVRQRRFGEAEPLLRKALLKLDKGDRGSAFEIREFLFDFAFALDRLAQGPEAEPIYRRIADAEEAQLGSASIDLAATLEELALSLSLQTAPGPLRTYPRLAESVALFRRAVAIREAALGADSITLASPLELLGRVLSMSMNYPERDAVQRRVVALHKRAGTTGVALADALALLGGYLDGNEGIAYLREAVAVERGVGDVERLLTAREKLALALRYNQEYDASEALYREILAERARGTDAVATASAATLLALVLVEANDMEQAKTFARSALQGLRAADRMAVEAANAYDVLATVAAAGGDLPAAETFLREGLKILDVVLAPYARLTGAALAALGKNLTAQRRFAEAEPLLRRARDIHVAWFTEFRADAGYASMALATAVAGRGGRTEAAGLFAQGLAAMRRDLGLENKILIAPTTAYARFALDDDNRPALARTLVRDAGKLVIERTARAAIDRRAERGLQQNRPTLLLAVRVAWQLAGEGGKVR